MKFYFFIIFLLPYTIINAQENTHKYKPLFQALENKKIIPKGTFEKALESQQIAASDTHYLYAFQLLKKLFDEKYNDQYAFRPGIREKSGKYWITYKGKPKNKDEFASIPLKPDELKKYYSLNKELVNSFAKFNLINQELEGKLNQLMTYSLILHPSHLIEAAAIGSIEEDINSEATLLKWFDYLEEGHIGPIGKWDFKGKIKSGDCGFGCFFSGLSSFKKVEQSAIYYAEEIKKEVGRVLSNAVSYKAKVDTVFHNFDTIHSEYIKETVQLKISHEGNQFNLEYPVRRGNNYPYNNIREFISSETFIMFANQVNTDEGKKGRYMYLDRDDLIESLLNNFSIGYKIRPEWYLLRKNKGNFSGFWRIKSRWYDKLWSERLITAKGVTIPLPFFMDGFEEYVDTNTKKEKWKQFKMLSIIQNMDSTSVVELKEKFISTTYSDPMNFFVKLDLTIDIFWCFDIISQAYGGAGNPHERMYNFFEKTTGGVLKVTDIATERAGEKKMKIKFKLNEKKYSYPLRSVENFYNVNYSPCTEVIMIASDACAQHPEVDGRFYYPLGYGFTSAHPGFPFYLTPKDAIIFSETFGVKLRPYVWR